MVSDLLFIAVVVGHIALPAARALAPPTRTTRTRQSG
jgi:hypothetical protein